MEYIIAVIILYINLLMITPINEIKQMEQTK